MAKKPKRVTLKAVIELANKDKKFFRSLLRNPEATLAKNNIELSPKDLKRLIMFSEHCVFSVPEVIAQMQSMGIIWPDAGWKDP